MNSLALLSCLLLVTTWEDYASCEDACGSDWNTNNDVGICLKYFEEKVSRSDAEEACQNLGGHLAVLRKDKHIDLFNSIIPSEKSAWVWIGLDDKEKEGVFTWANGRKLGDWSGSNNPDDAGGNEDCVVYTGGQVPNREKGGWKEMSSSEHRWNDYNCAGGSIATKYICQQPKKGECPSGWTGSESLCMKVFNSNVNQATAVKACTDMGEGVTLAMPKLKDREATQLVKKVLAGRYSYQWFWIGLDDKEKEGIWRWADGDYLGLWSDSTYEKADYPGQFGDCVGANRYGWDVFTCCSELAYVCQKKKE